MKLQEKGSGDGMPETREDNEVRERPRVRRGTICFVSPEARRGTIENLVKSVMVCLNELLKSAYKVISCRLVC